MTIKHKTIGIVTLLIYVLAFSACDPPRNCNEPKCMYSNVTAEFPVHLSGNLDSVINVGDTVRLYMRIPDTLVAYIAGQYHGNIVVEKLFLNTFFSIVSGGFDSISPSQTIGRHPLDPIPIKYSRMSSNHITWNLETKEYECVFVPKEPGKYSFDLSSGRVELMEPNGKQWLVNPIFKWDKSTQSNVRFEQFLSWMDISMRQEASKDKKVNRYFFEAK